MKQIKDWVSYWAAAVVYIIKTTWNNVRNKTYKD